MSYRRRSASDGARDLKATGAATSRPDVIVEFLFECGLFSIAVRNIGNQPALKVSASFDKKIVGIGGAKEISALAVFRNIEFLGPGREIVTFVDTSHSYFSRKEPTIVSVRVSYRDAGGASYEATITHDLEIYRELSYIVSSPTHSSV